MWSPYVPTRLANDQILRGKPHSVCLSIIMKQRLTVRFAQQELRGQVVGGAQYLGPLDRHGAPAHTLGGPEGGVRGCHGLGRLEQQEDILRRRKKKTWMNDWKRSVK